MTKRSKSNRKIIVASLVAVITLIITGVGILAWGSYHPKKLTDDATSARNITLMRNAIHDRDIKICDQIRGAINYTDPNADSRNHALSKGVSIVTPAMTESEAKIRCQSEVQTLINQERYEDQVCADKTISHYEFNNVRRSCPGAE